MRAQSCCITVYVEEGYTTACIRRVPPVPDRLLITGTETPGESVREVCHFLRDNRRLTVAGVAFVAAYSMSPESAIKLVRLLKRIARRARKGGT